MFTVQEYNYKICQMTATIPKSTKNLQPIQPPTRACKHICMDMICDLPVSSEGIKNILNTVSYLSKYVVVRPLESKTSEEFIQNLQGYILWDYRILSNKTKAVLAVSRLHINNRSTRAYHRISNGLIILVEVHNKNLKM